MTLAVEVPATRSKQESRLGSARRDESRALAHDEQSRCQHNPVPGVPAEEKTLAAEVAGEKLPILVIGSAERPFCFYDKGKKKLILF